MTNLYLMNITENTDAIRTAFTEYITEEKLSRIHRFRFEADQLRSLYGDVLTRHLICERLHITNDQIIFSKNEYGKPMVHDLPIHFNISHSGDFVLVGISDYELGVDIELRKENSLGIAKSFFHPTEYEAILHHANPNLLFYDIWCRKESYVKCIGKGLSQSLQSFCCIKDNHLDLITDSNEPLIARNYYISDQYSVSYCGYEEPNSELTLLHPLTVLNQLRTMHS